MIMICAGLFLKLSGTEESNYQNLPMSNWTFASYYLEYTSDWSAKLHINKDEIAAANYMNDKDKWDISSLNSSGRGEISSLSVKLKPFTWYKVHIKYSTDNTDSLIALVGLHPESKRSLMDLAILPPSMGKESAGTILLHTGAHTEDYKFVLGCTGIGSAQFTAFAYEEYASYARPDKEILMVDLLKLTPDSANLTLWSAYDKFVDLLGFKKPRYMHPLDVSIRELEAHPPGLIIFTPTATDLSEQKPGKLKKRNFDKGIKTLLQYAEKHNIAVLGICAGHQTIAQNYGAFLARLKDDDTGAYLYELGPENLTISKDDPIFKHLYRPGKIKIMEAHMIMVAYGFSMPQILATSDEFDNQIFKYEHGTNANWYTFQGHIEKDWEYACPEGAVILKNLLNEWQLLSARN